MSATASTGDDKRTELETVTDKGVCSFRRRRLWVAGFLLGLFAAGLALAGPYCRAWYHFRIARADLQRYHNAQAIRHLQICLRIWPKDPAALLLAARAARRAGVYAEAETCLRKYQQARGLDEAGTFEQLLLSAERGVDSVAELCRRYVEQGRPETPDILEALTRGYLRQYRLPEARACLDLWLQRQPDNVQALCLKGQFHLDYERALDRAATSYRRAVELDAEHEEARQGLAVVLLESKLFSEAAEHLEYLRNCQPDNLRVQVGLAQCRRALGGHDDVLRLVDEVLARQADYAPALALRGRLALEDQQYAEAETWLRQAVTLTPSDHRTRYNLILCLHHNGKEEEAKRHEQDINQWEQDVKRFNEIVTRDMVETPHDPALHFTLGRLLLRSGHQQEGLRWLHSALQLDPRYEPARQLLAECYQQTNPGLQRSTP